MRPEPELDLDTLTLTPAGDGIVLLTINRPDRLNTMTVPMFTDLARATRALPFPVIAAVHGAASGGGMSLALAADIRLAAPTARFNAAFVRVGLSAGELGTSWLLSRLVGPGRAAEIMFTARNVDAVEAERIGLVNRVVQDLMASSIAMARQVIGNSPAGVRMSKRALQRNHEVASYHAALELEVGTPW